MGEDAEEAGGGTVVELGEGAKVGETGEREAE